MLKYLYTIVLCVLSLLLGTSSYAGILEDENAIIQQWEQLLHNYNQEHNTNFLYTDVDAMPEITQTEDSYYYKLHFWKVNY